MRHQIALTIALLALIMLSSDRLISQASKSHGVIIETAGRDHGVMGVAKSASVLEQQGSFDPGVFDPGVFDVGD